jgi:hypothetical protein
MAQEYSWDASDRSILTIPILIPLHGMSELDDHIQDIHPDINGALDQDLPKDHFQKLVHVQACLPQMKQIF